MGISWARHLCQFREVKRDDSEIEYGGYLRRTRALVEGILFTSQCGGQIREHERSAPTSVLRRRNGATTDSTSRRGKGGTEARVEGSQQAMGPREEPNHSRGWWRRWGRVFQSRSPTAQSGWSGVGATRRRVAMLVQYVGM